MFIAKQTTIQFLRFAVIGCANTLIDMLVYLALTRGWAWWAEHYLWANVAAFAVANSHSFLLNRQWTFKSLHSWFRQYSRFLLTSLVYLGFLQGLFWLLTKYFMWYDIVAKMVVVALGALLYFISLKWWAFRSPLTLPKVE